MQAEDELRESVGEGDAGSLLHSLPRCIGGYVLLGPPLGEGAMGVVYAARDRRNSRYAAVKLVNPQLLPETEEGKFARERLFREAMAAARLCHEGIITIFEVGQDGDQPFIAMDLVDGPSLQEILDGDERLSTGQTLEILKQVAAALDHAHQRGVVHRDIKPANIMLGNFVLNQSVRAKLTDFGIARLDSLAAAYTCTGLVMGTPRYWAPEQSQGSASSKSDQYSLAVVAHEMLTGGAAGRTTSAAALGPLVVKVFNRALDRFPQNRYPTCTEFVNALGSALGGADPDAPLLSAESARSMASIDSGLLGGACGGAVVAVAYYSVYPSFLRATLIIAFALVAGGVFGAAAQFGVPSLGRLSRKYQLIPKNTWLRTVLLSAFAGMIVGTLNVNFLWPLGGGPVVSGQLLICAYLLGTVVIGLPSVLREYELRLANVLRVTGTALAISGLHFALGAAAILPFRAEFNSGFMSPAASGAGYIAGCSVGAAIGALMGSQLSLTALVVRNLPGLLPRHGQAIDASYRSGGI